MKLAALLLLISFSSFSANKCSKAGEEWHPFLPGSGYKTCCPGFVGTSQWQATHKVKECLPGPPGDRGYCVKCGDKKCDTEHFENKCICPADCK